MFQIEYLIVQFQKVQYKQQLSTKNIISNPIINSLSMKQSKNQPTKYKVLILGPSAVGKTSLLQKYVKNTFCYDYQVTLGVEFYSKIVKVNDKYSANLQVWDTMGQENFKAVVKQLYKGVSGIVLAYSITSKQSFNQLSIWYKQIQETSHKQVIIWLVGTKLDLDDIRQVSKTAGQQFAKSIGASGFIEVSSKTGENVQQVFEKLGRSLVKKYITSENFRELVSPTFEDSISKTGSVNLVNYRVSLKESKQQCC